jgi:hypothetical protein
MHDPASRLFERSFSKNFSASDFLLGAEAFVERCVSAFAGSDQVLSAGERAALADAIRMGRPRIEIVETMRRLLMPLASTRDRPQVDGVSQCWGQFIVTDLLERYAPDDDEAFIQQVYAQVLDRSPSSIEALEASFDLKGRLTREEFIKQLAGRSPACRLSSDVAPAGVGSAMTKDARLCFNFIEYAESSGWILAPDVWLQHAPTVDGALRLAEGCVLRGPKRSFPAGDWQLAIDIVQPETATIVVEVVANAGLDVLVKFSLAGPARLVTPFSIEPWHHFVEVRLLKRTEPEQHRWLKMRQLVLRQS